MSCAEAINGDSQSRLCYRALAINPFLGGFVVVSFSLWYAAAFFGSVFLGDNGVLTCYGVMFFFFDVTWLAGGL